MADSLTGEIYQYYKKRKLITILRSLITIFAPYENAKIYRPHFI